MRELISIITGYCDSFTVFLLVKGCVIFAVFVIAAGSIHATLHEAESMIQFSTVYYYRILNLVYIHHFLNCSIFSVKMQGV